MLNLAPSETLLFIVAPLETSFLLNSNLQCCSPAPDSGSSGRIEELEFGSRSETSDAKTWTCRRNGRGLVKDRDDEGGTESCQ